MKIRMENIIKTFNLPTGEQLTVLEDISLAIEQGDFIMILGESGCGKSTLLNLLAGLLPLSSGEIWVDDRKVVSPHPSISMLFQQPCLLPWLNVEENIAFGCRIRGELDNLEYRVSQFIELVGLSIFSKSYPSELSVGMAYRVSLARALIGHPEIFLFDEPFASLDTFTRTRIQEELINIWLSERFTAVFVTHNIDEAILMGNKIVLLGGKPSRIKDIVDISLKYPRNITDESFFHSRTSILKKFKEAFVGNNSL